MEFALLVWFIEVFVGINFVPPTGAFVGLTLIAFLVSGMIILLIAEDEPAEGWWKFWRHKAPKPFLWVAGILFLANSFGDLVPDKDAAYKIAAAYGVQQAYEAASGSEEVKRMAGKSLKVLESSMDQYLAEGLATIVQADAVVAETVSSAASSVTSDDVDRVKEALVNRAVEELKPKKEE